MERDDHAGGLPKEEKRRSSFSGKLGYVLAVAGSAVGLGNIWRFPYLAAKYGGGIFLLVYLILMLSLPRKKGQRPLLPQNCRPAALHP